MMWQVLRPLGRLKFLRDLSGATAIEYALMLGLVVLAVVGAFHALGDSMTDMYGYVSSSVISVMPAG